MTSSRHYLYGSEPVQDRIVSFIDGTHGPTAKEVLGVFQGGISAVLDGGPSRLKAPSSVVRVDGDRVEVLREGALTEREIRAALRE